METRGVKWFVIVNPVAGGGRGLDHFPQISKHLRDAYIRCEPVFTEHKFHATELPVTAVREGYRHIIVVGGDGTLHEVVNGLFIQQEVRPDEVLLALDRHRHGVVQEPGVRDVELRDKEGQTDVARQVDEVDFGLEGGLPSEDRPQDARKHGEVGRLERRVERTFEVVHLLAVVLAVDEDRHLALLDAERTAPPDGILAAARHPCGRPFPHQIIGFVAADDIQDAAFRLVFAEKSHLILPFFSVWPYPTHNAAQPGRQMRPRRPSGRRQDNYLQSSGRTPGRPSSPGNR